VGQPGCSRVLLLGFVHVEDPEPIRRDIQNLRDQVNKDTYLKSIPSIRKTMTAFHAKDDCPEVRMMVYRMLAKHQFAAQAIVARKIEPMFRTRYRGSRDRFYEDLVSRLFENNLHKSETNVIIFSRRGNKIRQHAMRAAIARGVERFRKKWNTDVATEIRVQTLRSSQEPLLQVVDYTNWAVQRAFERGEMRYYDFLRDKYELICDVFDKANYKGGGNFYDRNRNPFEIKKASPLG